jgi:hypothetical protein
LHAKRVWTGTTLERSRLNQIADDAGTLNTSSQGFLTFAERKGSL